MALWLEHGFNPSRRSYGPLILPSQLLPSPQNIPMASLTERKENMVKLGKIKRRIKGAFSKHKLLLSTAQARDWYKMFPVIILKIQL